jgi:hypothetical protein
MKLRPNPVLFQSQIFQSIRAYVFVAWFPDLSVSAIRICILACLYNLKANRNQFSKYFEVYMILKDDCTERPLLAIEVWSAEVETTFPSPPLGYNFLWVTWPASTRVFPPQEGRAWERGWIAACITSSTSYPGSFHYAPRWRKDPGPGWSRVSQILGDNKWDL